MNRRNFNRLVLWGGVSAATTRIFWPKPAQSYETSLDLRNFSAGLVFNSFRQYSAARVLPGRLDAILQGRSSNKQVNTSEAVIIRQSDQALRSKGYVQGRTELASAGQVYTEALLWGRQRQEQVGINPAFGFVQEYQGAYSDSRLSGPSIGGIYRAQEVLANERVSPDEVAGLLLPLRSTYEDRLGWDGEDGNHVGFVGYETALGIVNIRYDAEDFRPGGRGRIEISAEGEQHAPRRIVVWVRYA